MVAFVSGPQGEQDMAESYSNGGWRSYLLGITGTCLFAFIGWTATDATTARNEMNKELAASVQRIAILEESNRNMRESLARIEAGVDELRHAMQDRRR
jgi:sigma54-dependent transcription regulator